MLRLKTIDGDDNVDMVRFLPAAGNDAEGAGYNLHMDTALHEPRHQNLEFSIPYKRIATDDREVQGFLAVDYIENTIDERVPLEVGQIPQRLCAAEMVIFIGITTGASQGTLASDFNR
jgi:hypothetical protein